MAISRNTPLAVFNGIEQFLNDPSIKTKDESSKVRMKYVFSAPDRMALASQIHENFDKAKLDYSTKVMPGSSFPSTVVPFQNQGKVKSALIQYKPLGGKKADAKTTLMQEKASTYVFERVLKDNKTWKDVQAMMDDDVTMKGIKDVYPSVDFEWLEVFHKQHVKMFSLYSSAQFDVFDHSGTGSFMDYISQLVNQKFGITKKDNWDPADMWIIKGSVATVTKVINDNISGSKATQTIEELNTIMREMFTKKIVVGVSLKKVSGSQAQWEEFNVKELTLEERDDYNFPNVESKIRLDANMSQDTVVKLTKSGGQGYKFQIKANDSKSFSNLKWEATQIGAGAARGGKAQVDLVVQLLKDAGQDFDKSNRNYPQNIDDFKKKQREYITMFNFVSTKADTDINTSDEFVANIENKFLTEPYVANSKLMQLAFLNALYKISPKKDQLEVWTDMVFLAIKKGNKFGPFGKLY